jgi:hypothetical protein
MNLKLKYSGCVTILAVAACMATSAGQPAYPQINAGLDAYDGTWNLDIAKTDFGNSAAPKSVTLTLTGTRISRKWTQVTVGTNGKSQTRSYDRATDNRYYPITGSPDGSTFAYMTDGSFAVKDKSGKVVQTTTYSLSADGSTMTLQSTRHSPHGEETHVAVFQKER